MKNPSPKLKWTHYNPYVYPTTEKIFLSKDFPSNSIDFLDVFLSRRSSQKCGSISITKLSELLYYSAKTQYVQVDDYGALISKKAAPSAGARHPVDLLVSPTPISDKRRLTYYNPIDHSLSKLALEESLVQNFFEEVNQNVPLNNASLIWFSIQPGKTSSKYKNANSLYWRDCGALLYCIQLTCTYLGLNSCPLGTLAANTFENISENVGLVSGGGILVGEPL